MTLLGLGCCWVSNKVGMAIYSGSFIVEAQKSRLAPVHMGQGPYTTKSLHYPVHAFVFALCSVPP